MTKKEEAQELYRSGKSIREIMEITGRRESSIRKDCAGIVILEEPVQKTEKGFARDFPEDWNATCEPFRFAIRIREARKEHKMLRLDKIRRLSILQITDILINLNAGDLEKVGCIVPDRWELVNYADRRRYISEWLMEEVKK